MECSICINEVSESKIFKCLACKYTNCIDCHKKYLLSTSQYPHCINPDCRSAIPYDIFLLKFNKKWVFSEYKNHRSNILLNREKGMLQDTVRKIAIEKEIEEKRKAYMNEIVELRKQMHAIEDKIWALGKEKVEKKRYAFTYACPSNTCKGFLNEDFKCGLCSSIVCNKCYVIKDGTKKGDHECEPDMIETFNAIKKEAKPCPTCGEFISKINGCDQMFCTSCGTAFSWKTGLVEKGIIHNPHAHQFFQNNPEALNAYQNNGAMAGACRQPVPSIIQLNRLKFLGENLNYLITIHRYISEFRQYRRNNVLRILNDNNTDMEKNIDIRMKYINNVYDEKSFKHVLHKRDKHTFYSKQLSQLILYTYEIAEVLLWNIVDLYDSNIGFKINPNIVEQINKNIELLKQNSYDTQNNINSLKEDFGYTISAIFNVKYQYLGSY